MVSRLPGSSIRKILALMTPSLDAAHLLMLWNELTETGNYPEGGVDAMKAAIPLIAESAKLKDQMMQQMSNEVLSQIVRLSGRATRI